MGELIDNILPILFGELNMKVDEIHNSTFKDLINYIDGLNRRQTILFSNFENLFLMYNAVPQYATHSSKKKKFNPKKLFENKMYRLNLEKKKRSLEECKGILADIDKFLGR